MGSGLLLLAILAILVGGIIGIAVHDDDGAAEDADVVASPTTSTTSTSTTSTTTTTTAAPGAPDVVAPDIAGGTGAGAAGTGAGTRAGAAGTGTGAGAGAGTAGSPSTGAGTGGATSPGPGGAADLALPERMPNTGAESTLLPSLLLLAFGAGARRLAVVSRRG